MNIQKRMILDNSDVDDLDKLQNEQNFEESSRARRNLRRRYLRLVKKITGSRYDGHYYTGSGTNIVPGSTEVYFGD